METTFYRRLYKKVLSDATVNIRGVHGSSHWARVIRNGVYIAEREQLSPVVIKCFALLHDSQRLHDGDDPEHGNRAAAYAIRIKEAYMDISDIEFEKLLFACRHHTNSIDTTDKIIHACWDADRLDLGRIGITPDAFYIRTQTATTIADDGTFHLLEEFKPREGMLLNVE